MPRGAALASEQSPPWDSPPGRSDAANESGMSGDRLALGATFGHELLCEQWV